MDSHSLPMNLYCSFVVTASSLLCLGGGGGGGGELMESANKEARHTYLSGSWAALISWEENAFKFVAGEARKVQ